MSAADPRLTTTRGRQVAHSVLGPVLPWLLHLRPMEWPIVAAHCAIGWWLATGVLWPSGTAWLAIAVWVVALNGGTLALNSAFDRDEGDIAYLRNPPTPPRGLAIGATLLMLSGLALTWGLPIEYRAVYLLSVVLSLMYSVPPLRLKAVGGADWVINMIGFGTLTAYAGWAITGRPLTVTAGLIFVGFCPLFAALYPLTQLYQMDEDRARGDRTLVLRLGGAQRSLAVAIVCTGIAFAAFLAAGWLAGWRGGEDLARWGALVIAGLAWCAVLFPWYQQGHTWSSREHQRGMYHALVAWAITDAAILLAWQG